MEKKDLKKEVIKIIKELKGEYLKEYKKNLVSIVLFGSYANDFFTPVSDVDLIIIFEKIKDSKLSIYSKFFFISENLPTYKKLKKEKIYLNFSPIIKEKSHLNVNIPYLWNTNFKIFYDKDGFFKQFISKLEDFKKKKIKLKEGIMPYYEIVKNG